MASRTTQSGVARKPSKMAVSSSREKERFLSLLCRHLGRRKFAMLLLVVVAVLVFVFGPYTVNKESNAQYIVQQIENVRFLTGKSLPEFLMPPSIRAEDTGRDGRSSRKKTVYQSVQLCTSHDPRSRPQLNLRSRPCLVSSGSSSAGHGSPWGQRCEYFAFPPPPPPDRRRIGPRPSPVCYLPLQDDISSMPSFRQYLQCSET